MLAGYPFLKPQKLTRLEGSRKRSIALLALDPSLERDDISVDC